MLVTVPHIELITALVVLPPRLLPPYKLSTDIFGYVIPVMKLTSVVPMILTMVLSATVVRKRHGFVTSTLFTLALMSMPNLLFFGVEIRMYSLGFFFATASGIYVYEVICEPTKKNWCLFTVFSVLAGYSHHFAFVAVGIVYLYLLIYSVVSWKKSKKGTTYLIGFIKCLIATFVLYFPCLITTLKQFKSVSGYFSMPDVTLKVFIKYCRYPYTVGLTALSILLLLFVAFLVVRTLLIKEKTDKDYYSLWCILVYYIVLLFGTAISKVMTANIFVDRYLFFSLGMIWLFVAIQADALKKVFKYILIVFLYFFGKRMENIFHLL